MASSHMKVLFLEFIKVVEIKKLYDGTPYELETFMYGVKWGKTQR